MLHKLKNFIVSNSVLLKTAKLIKSSGESSPLVYHCRDYTKNKFIRTLLKILVTPFCMIRYFIGYKDNNSRDGLAFVLIAKNEASYIKEWLDFHIKQGVSKFIIYNNESTDNFYEVLKPYIESGIVIYDEIHGKRRQIDVYNMALRKYRNQFKYISFIDADEFVYVRNNTYGGGGHCNLFEFMEDFMAKYKNAAGIGINWLIFGSNNHEKRPEGGVLENFTRCAERDFFYNHYTKAIYDSMRVFVTNVHHPSICFNGFNYLNEDGEILTFAPTKKVLFNKIRVNHYPIKSKEEFMIKKNIRGDVAAVNLKSETYFDDYNRNDIEDTEILSYK